MSTSPDDSFTRNRHDELIRINVVFLSLSILAVVLRMFTRVKIVSAVGTEDYLLIGALAACAVETAFQLMEVKHGAGKHYYELTPEQGSKQLQYLYLSIIFYGTSLALVKSSLVLQYLRIFLLHHRTRLACHVILYFVAAYSAGTVLAATFTCWPIPGFWNPTLPARCINKTALWFSHAALSIFTDFAILLAPIPVLLTLHLPMRQKVGIMLIFAVGSFACITSILRLHYLYVVSTSKDVTYDNVGAIIWSSVEVNIFIICASATGLKPLYVQVVSRHGTERLSSNHAQTRRRVPSSGTLALSGQDLEPMKNHTVQIHDHAVGIDSTTGKTDLESQESLSTNMTGRQHSDAASGRGSRKSNASDRHLIRPTG